MDRRSNSFQFLSPANYLQQGDCEGQEVPSFKLSSPSGRRPSQSQLHNSKSLPNIEFSARFHQQHDEKLALNHHGHDHGHAMGDQDEPPPVDVDCDGGGRKHRKRLLQKTWDKVKTIITHSSSSSQVALLRRRNSNSAAAAPTKGQASKRSPSSGGGCCSSSATNSPVAKQTFDFNVGVPPLSPPTSTELPPAPPGAIYPDERERDRDDVLDNFIRLQRRLSDELHQSMMQRSQQQGGGGGGGTANLSADFKKKLQQWEMWRASSGKHKYTEQELQQLIPQDYAKKLEEWEQIKAGGGLAAAKPPKSAKGGGTKDKEREKELAWLEKQLMKVEREKTRLELQLLKCTERERELRRLKEAHAMAAAEVTPWGARASYALPEYGIGLPQVPREEFHTIDQELVNGALRTLAEHALPFTPASTSTVGAPSTTHAHHDLRERRSSSSGGSSAACSVDYEDADEFDESYSKSRATSTDSTDAKPAPPGGACSLSACGLGAGGGFRRSSDATTSTPLSTRSLSGFESDDGEFGGPPPGFLKTVSEENTNANEERVAARLRVEPVVLEDDCCASSDEEASGGHMGHIHPPCNAIVPTRRMIFKPVHASDNGNANEAPPMTPPFSLRSPGLVRGFVQPLTNSSTRLEPGPSNQSANPVGNAAPRIVGVIRKTSDVSSGSRGRLAKIPVWCSPMLSRRGSAGSSKAKPPVAPAIDMEFSIDKFLEESNLLSSGAATMAIQVQGKPPAGLAPQPPARASRIPVTSPGGRKIYPANNLLQRSSSFQGQRATRPRYYSEQQPAEGLTPIAPPSLQLPSACAPPPATPPSKVFRSKSTGTILGLQQSKLVAFASKLGFKPSAAAAVAAAGLP